MAAPAVVWMEEAVFPAHHEEAILEVWPVAMLLDAADPLPKHSHVKFKEIM